MKTCSQCDATNDDGAKACGTCGAQFLGGPARSAPKFEEPPQVPSVRAASLSRSIKLGSLQSRRKADVLFVLDCTGSMQGEIDAVKDAIISFANLIESDGVQVRVGLIEFRDRLIAEEHRILLFDGQPFTNDPGAFQRQVSALRASGGGDAPESSHDALLLAASQPFAEGAQKVLVLITDAPPHIPDREAKSIDQVVQGLRAAGIHQLYLVIPTKDPQCEVYLQLFESGARGQSFELGKGNDFRARAEDFKRTLMALGKTISTTTRSGMAGREGLK
jgi:Mg-chelatase subunit ChlD